MSAAGPVLTDPKQKKIDALIHSSDRRLTPVPDSSRTKWNQQAA